MILRKYWKEITIAVCVNIFVIYASGVERERRNSNYQVNNEVKISQQETPAPVNDVRMITIHSEKINGDIPYYNGGTYTITAYCGCEECCGEYAKNRPNGIVKGSAGVELKQGYSVASPLPNGTMVEIEGLGSYEVQDTPAQWVNDRYNDKIIDLYFDKHEDAEAFGKTTKEVRVWN